MQELFDRFAEEQAESATRTADISMDLMTAPARDEERQRLDARFKELEEESIRDNFVIIYELMDEMMDFGYPQTTESKILQEYVFSRISWTLNPRA